MGNWQLEVGKMMLYTSFPVGIFHYFNQRENIEEWIISHRKKHCPPISKKQYEDFLQHIEEYNKKKQMLQLQKMELQYQEIKGKETLPA